MSKTLLLTLGATFAMAAGANAQILVGLENYWPLNGNANDAAHGVPGTASTVADNGFFDGTNGVGGIGYGPGLFGDAITQNGATAGQDDGFVRVPRSADTLHGGRSISISAWVQTDGIDTGWQTILSHGEGSQYRIAARGSDFPPIASYAGGVGDIPTAAGIGPDIGPGTGWHHILAISESGVSTRLWVDGGLVATGGAPFITDNGNDGAPGGSTPDLYIGANPQTGAQNREWWGQIDDVGIWNRPLSDAEIGTIYQAGLAGASLGSFIPEPSTGILSLLGIAVVGLRRRR